MTVLLPPFSALHRWAHELRTLLGNRHCADAAEWQLQGHAVLLESNFIEEVHALLEQIAKIAGMPLHLFSPAGVVEESLSATEALA